MICLMDIMVFTGWTIRIYFVIIGAVICLIASAGMNSTFSRYQRVRSMSGMTGAMAAERILRDAGIHDVQVQHIQGNLTDHYNPMNKTLSLSDSVYNSTSVAAVGVAAHECGHAIQHAKVMCRCVSVALLYQLQILVPTWHGH